MPVIINDFEIEVAPPPTSATRGEGGGEQSSPQSSQTKPEQINAVVRVNCERMERVRAD